MTLALTGRCSLGRAEHVAHPHDLDLAIQLRVQTQRGSAAGGSAAGTAMLRFRDQTTNHEIVVAVQAYGYAELVVTRSAPNCTVSPISSSKLMMRPVILSRPENEAIGLEMVSASDGVANSARASAAQVEHGGRRAR